VKRRTAAYVRQGEWFFVPANIQVDASEVLHNEPINRGSRGSTDHRCEYLTRHGGITVWVHPILASTGASQFEYMTMFNDQDRKKPGWRTMVRDAKVYVKGKISHRDHATIDLKGWHRVFLNNEAKAKHAQAVVFLD
jgi:hypothetical protein